LNINQSSLDSISTKVSIQNISNKAGEKQTNAEVAFGVGYISSFLIYFFVFYFGTQVMQGVMEEKTNRIIEVIISSVRPFELMLGKIIGIAGVALTQILIWGHTGQNIIIFKIFQKNFKNEIHACLEGKNMLKIN